MLNPLLDAYGIGNPLAAVQSVVSGQNALVASAQTAGSVNAVDKNKPDTVNSTVSKEVLDDAVKKLNEFVAPALQTIQFSMDQESDRLVVKVVDTSTQQVLRQIPNEEVLAISRTLDKLQGLVIRQTA